MLDPRAGQHSSDRSHRGSVEGVELLIQEGVCGVACGECRPERVVHTQVALVGGVRARDEVREVFEERVGPQARNRVRQGQRSQAPRLRERERRRPPAAHRLTDQVHALAADCIKDGDEVGDGRLHVDHARRERRAPEPAAVPGHDAIAGVRQWGHLLEPRGV